MTGFEQSVGTLNPASEISPTGTLRVAMVGIRVLAGIGEHIGGFVAAKLGASFEPVIYPNPDAYKQSFGKGQWEIAVGPRILVPPDKADATSDIWLIDLLYLAAPGHGPTNTGEVDRRGRKVVAIQNSPSDLALTRAITSAEIVRVPITPKFTTDAVEMLRSGKADIIGADAGLVDEIVGLYPQAKVIGAFHTNPVAAALPKGRSGAALAKLTEILTDAKRSGVVQDAIEQAGLRTGVRVAPN